MVGKRYLDFLIRIEKEYEELHKKHHDMLQKKMQDNSQVKLISDQNEELLRKMEEYCGLDSVSFLILL